MKTHSMENYHICPYPDCGKRYEHEYKLKNHISSHHEKGVVVEPTKYAPPVVEKPVKTPKSNVNYASASSDRPYTCPYEGRDKAYIHEYKLNLHLRREHPGHFKEDNAKNAQPNADNDMDEGSDQDAYPAKRSNDKKPSRSKPNLKLPPAKVTQRKGSTATASPANMNAMRKQQWPPVKGEVYDEEDSEETEEERDNVGGDDWRYAQNDDDEETEYEDLIVHESMKFSPFGESNEKKIKITTSFIQLLLQI